ncbi:MAG: carbohydrate ABC transporter permease [Saccharofermentanales bacterium]
MKRWKLSLHKKRALYGFVFVSPWIIGILLFFVNPILRTIQFSFSEIIIDPELNGYSTVFIGLQNFYEAFRIDIEFPKRLLASLIQMVTEVPIILIFSFFVAVLLKDKFRGASAVKTIFFLTVVLSSGVFLRMQAESSGYNNIVIGGAAQSMGGVMASLSSFNIEGFLLQIGLSEQLVNYIVGPINNLYLLMTRSGIQIFIFLAGLHSISPSLYEACHMEGATGWETFWKVTFPMVSPLILVNTVYTVIDSFTSFTNTTIEYIYNTAFGTSVRFAYSSSLSLVYFLIVGLCLGLISAMVSRKVFYQ